MNPSAETTLVDARGRKYLTADERTRFLAAVRAHPKPQVQTLARTLALTGCRVSEALATRACDVDLEAAEIRIATLKRRTEHWRAVPVPADLIHELDLVHRVRRAQASPRGRTALLWNISRQAAHCQVRVDYGWVLNDTVRRVRHRSRPSIFAREQDMRPSERRDVRQELRGER